GSGCRGRGCSETPRRSPTPFPRTACLSIVWIAGVAYRNPHMVAINQPGLAVQGLDAEPLVEEGVVGPAHGFGGTADPLDVVGGEDLLLGAVASAVVGG